MVQFLSINFFSWISSIFVGFFKSSRFFVSLCTSGLCVTSGFCCGVNEVCSAGMLTQHRQVVSYRCFRTTYPSSRVRLGQDCFNLEDGTDGLELSMLCNIPEEQIYNFCCFHYYYYYYYYYILACCISKIFNVHSVHAQ